MSESKGAPCIANEYGHRLYGSKFRFHNLPDPFGEVATLRHQIATAQAENEALMLQCERFEKVITRSRERNQAMEAENEALRARVAELSEKSDRLSYAIVHSLTDKQQDRFARQFAELQDTIAASSSVAWLLSKQAEAVERLISMENYALWYNREFVRVADIKTEAQHLRQQADELERVFPECPYALK